VLITDSTEETFENPTDFTLVKARGVLEVKAAAPAIRERATASFMIERYTRKISSLSAFLTKSEGKTNERRNMVGGASVTQTRTTTHKHVKAIATIIIAPFFGCEWLNLWPTNFLAPTM
jgi:hypothetical protein